MSTGLDAAKKNFAAAAVAIDPLCTVKKHPLASACAIFTFGAAIGGSSGARKSFVAILELATSVLELAVKAGAKNKEEKEQATDV